MGVLRKQMISFKMSYGLNNRVQILPGSWGRCSCCCSSCRYNKWPRGSGLSSHGRHCWSRLKLFRFKGYGNLGGHGHWHLKLEMSLLIIQYNVQKVAFFQEFFSFLLVIPSYIKWILSKKNSLESTNFDITINFMVIIFSYLPIWLFCDLFQAVIS